MTRTMAQALMLTLCVALPAASRAQSLNAQLEAAIRANNATQVTAVLSRGASPHHATDGGTPMLVLAANMADLGAVKLLLERGARVDARSKKGTTALHAAAQFGRKDVAQLLLQGSADVNDPGMGMTPLHAAVYGQQGEMIDFLVDNGAKVDAPVYMGVTALQLAVILNQSDDRVVAAVALLKKGANPNVVDSFGDTPLHSALIKTRPSVTMIKALLFFGASLTTVSRRGETPLELGKKSSVKAIAALFNEPDIQAKVKADPSLSVSFPKGEPIRAGEKKPYTLTTPFDAVEGGLHVRIKLGGNLASAFRLTSPRLVASHPAMAWYWLHVPSGEKEVLIELQAPPSITRATSIGISSSQVTKDGELHAASHLDMIIPVTPKD